MIHVSVDEVVYYFQCNILTNDGIFQNYNDCTYIKIIKNQLHAVSRTQQRGPTVKTLRFPLSAEFWRHCVLSGGTQRRTLLRHQRKR